ncbi:ubiquitin-like domain-containing protein [Kordiimonas pumila]|uniref:Ubiquitin-like domain-containing protein n=1 Tax=Kordiimonas pumila TaxID=2161677 RepID=A0ABV7D4J3_9PROT|nr:ubiquitin-like domain-containing protein [Kordiimonas pumila]
MKKIILAAALVAIMAPAALAGDRVKVEYNDKIETFDVEGMKITSVCGLKKMVAEEFKLRVSAFDLVKNNQKLNEDKTLYADSVHSYDTLQVKEKSSFQCQGM